ncbi:T9SS type A sorting domain-containing protein [Chryseobacterium kwangjuense]|uniref:T9SS type A sorting domain-containing protein n=1 Tax=Chryseobacterium kwangjuense TaxID=267125 RepID=A0ABW9K2I2_9FLAO
MKKTLLMSWALLIFSFSAINAQPTLTSADIITGTFQYTEIGFNQGVYNPGNGGANVTWNFSNVQGTTGGVKIKYGTCPGIAECTSFPTANMYAVTMDNNGNQSDDKNLFRKTSTLFEAVGARNLVTNYTLTYTDTPIELKFPTTYLQSFTDTSSYTINGITTTTNDVITADGYGTIITPAGTYTNVLRVKKESLITISFPGVPNSVTQLITYTWYKNNREQIAGFSVTNMISPISQPAPSSFQYTNNLVLAVNETSAKKSVPAVYPNPVKDGKIWIDIKDDEIRSVDIFDMTGKKVLTQSAEQLRQNEGKYEMDLHGVSDGYYILKANSSKETFSDKIRIQQNKK